MMDTSNWKEFFLKDICNISMGNKLDFVNMTCDDPIVNFVGRSADNNGVAGRVDLISGIVPYKPGCLTVALGGSLGCTYLQTDYFYTSQNVSVLEFSEDVTEKAKLFMSAMIMNECKCKYMAFGRELNVHIRTDFSVYLPTTIDTDGHPSPDWGWMEAFMSQYYQGPLQSQNHFLGQHLAVEQWQEFRVGNLFDSITKAEAYSKDALEDCDVLNSSSIPHVTRTDENNAVDAFVVNDGFSKVEKGNAIVVGDTTSTISYQPDDFIAGDHIVVMRSGWLNIWTGLFFVSLLRKERFRYSYGRAFVMPLIADTVVKLPADSDGKPDWTWMEQYMRSLPYSDLIDKRQGETSVKTPI